MFVRLAAAPVAQPGRGDSLKRSPKRLANRLLDEANAGRPITALYTSPVRRARETALAVAALTGTKLVILRDLRVPEPDQADGLAWDDVRRRWPPDPDRPTRPLIDGGEAWPAYLDHAHACCLSTILDRPGGRTVVVGHSETATAAFTLLVGVRTLGVLKVDLEPTGITPPHHRSRTSERAGHQHTLGTRRPGAGHDRRGVPHRGVDSRVPNTRTTVRASTPAAAEVRPQSPVDAGDPRHPASTGSTRKAAS